ncbi:MAG: hypothetical protein IJA33_00635 [Oscillospiraceae bacterium]|nr:hypothetical protein [Oscillospiraceae bacterium]
MAQKYRHSGASTYGSLAYDLDALVLERQLEEAGTMPERRAERKAQPVQRRRSEAHAQAKARPSALMVGGIVTMCALIVVLLLGYVQLTAASASVSQLNNTLSELQSEHVALLTEYEKTFDLATIKATAEAAGMSKPNSGQIQYIDLSGSDTVVVYTDEPGMTARVFADVRQSAASVVEFFR